MVTINGTNGKGISPGVYMVDLSDPNTLKIGEIKTGYPFNVLKGEQGEEAKEPRCLTDDTIESVIV